MLTIANETAGGTPWCEGIEDARQIIIKLERRLREAERERDESVRVRSTRQGQATESQDKWVG